MDRYIADLEVNPLPAIGIDQVRVHLDGATAVVSARSCNPRAGSTGMSTPTSLARVAGSVSTPASGPSQRAEVGQRACSTP